MTKLYQLYDRPVDRFIEALDPRRKKYHRDFYALRDISFEVKKGDTLGIIGRNGSGKSTLLKIISGVLSPTAGTYGVNGRIASLLELGTGFNPELTGIENIYFNGTLLGLSKEEIDEKLEGIIAFADIGEFIRQPVKIYSNGMFVRLAFAVIVHVDADIILIDEALAVGDAAFVYKCMRFLRNFMEKGTLLFVSHDIAAVRSICTRSIWLDKGIMKGIGDTKTILDAYTVDIYADQQDTNGAAKKTEFKSNELLNVVKRDCRLDFVNNSNLRNDIQVFELNEHAYTWGNGKAKIIATFISYKNNMPVSWIIGGEEIILTIKAKAFEDLQDVILGFQVRNRTGQILFGDNTFLTTYGSPFCVKAGTLFQAQFKFLLPILPKGNYAVVSAIVVGTQQDHIVLDWNNESIFFESHNGISPTGLVGIPMQSIHIEKVKE